MTNTDDLIVISTLVSLLSSAILYALAKQGRNLGAYKLTRLVYEKLHTLHIPNRFKDAFEMGELTIRAKPFSDAEVIILS